MTTPHTRSGEISPRALRLVRLVLMLGPLLMGAVFAFVTMESGPFLEDPALARMLRLVFLGIAGAAALGVGVVRRHRMSASDDQRQASLSILGWAMGETAAIFGAVYLLLFGSGLVYLVGLLVLGTAYLLLPIPEHI